MNITYEQVKAAKASMIYYSINTAWWTHDPKDLFPGPVPLDAFGSPLLQSTQVDAWLNEAAIKGCAAYGQWPLEALMMAHAQNIKELPPTIRLMAQIVDVVKHRHGTGQLE